MKYLRVRYKKYKYEIRCNSNTQSLTRTDGAGNTLHRLEYSYNHPTNGNALTSINLNGTPSNAFEYDQNGNMTFDGQSGVRIDYNLLNLPQKVATNGQEVTYLYSADGTKLATIAPNGSRTYYRSVFTYAQEPDQPEALLYAMHPEGIVTKTNTSWEYKYFKRDHVGSTRVLLAARGNQLVTEQQTDYYPFGLTHGGLNNLHLNRYLYGGKEYQDVALGGTVLGLYDFHARYYNPLLGRWFNPDPANQFSNPYLYCLNNPLAYTDPDGRFVWTVINAIKDFAVNTFGKVWTEGVNAWSDKDNWHSTQMAWKVDIGLYRGDLKQVLSRFTWELPQTMLGYVTNGFLVTGNAVKSASYWGGATAVETYSSGWGGFTLGNYITGERGLYADPNNTLFQHEYGHYLQSQRVGWGYLISHAIPSLKSAIKDKPNNTYKHDNSWTEQDANKSAYEYFYSKMGSDLEWNFSDNPINDANWVNTVQSKYGKNIIQSRYSYTHSTMYAPMVSYPFNDFDLEHTCQELDDNSNSTCRKSLIKKLLSKCKY